MGHVPFELRGAGATQSDGLSVFLSNSYEVLPVSRFHGNGPWILPNQVYLYTYYPIYLNYFCWKMWPTNKSSIEYTVERRRYEH